MAVQNKYDEDFKKSRISLYQNGKNQSQRCKECGVSKSAPLTGSNNIPPFRLMRGEALTAKQVKELQKRNAQLEEEKLILKKRLPSLRHTLATTERSGTT